MCKGRKIVSSNGWSPGPWGAVGMSFAYVVLCISMPIAADVMRDKNVFNVWPIFPEGQGKGCTSSSRHSSMVYSYAIGHLSINLHREKIVLIIFWNKENLDMDIVQTWSFITSTNWKSILKSPTSMTTDCWVLTKPNLYLKSGTAFNWSPFSGSLLQSSNLYNISMASVQILLQQQAHPNFLFRFPWELPDILLIKVLWADHHPPSSEKPHLHSCWAGNSNT